MTYLIGSKKINFNRRTIQYGICNHPPRKTGKKITELTAEENKAARAEGLYIDSWSIDRLSRVWLLMHLDSSGKEKYFGNIETLFSAGEMNELVALYSALPVLQYPELWKKRCAEGIRSNIADVLRIHHLQ